MKSKRKVVVNIEDEDEEEEESTWLLIKKQISKGKPLLMKVHIMQIQALTSRYRRYFKIQSYLYFDLPHTILQYPSTSIFLKEILIYVISPPIINASNVHEVLKSK